MQAPLLNIGPYLYQPKHQIDETKMSTLWVAMEQHHAARSRGEERVVLKIARMSDTKYSLTNQRAIENEEKWLSRLRHPNVVHLRPIAESQPSRQQIYRARSELPGNPWFLVTDFLSGGDLSSVLAERRKLPASLALEISDRIADAIAYLHQHNCVHCDIKPRNILFRQKPSGFALTPDTQPIVIDFGIAKNPTEGRQLVSGTPRWITPEMASAMSVGTRLEVDPSWDVYALGLVLYNILTGRKPKLDLPGSESWDRVTSADLAGDPSVVNAKALVDGLNKLLTGATADDHRQRLSADAFLAEVRRLRSYVRVPAAGKAPASSTSRRGLGLTLGVAGTALALGALLWWTGVLPGRQGAADAAYPTVEVAAQTSQPVPQDSGGGGGDAGGNGVEPDGGDSDLSATVPVGLLSTETPTSETVSDALPPTPTATEPPAIQPPATQPPATQLPATVRPTSTAEKSTSTPVPTSTPLPKPTKTATATRTPTFTPTAVRLAATATTAPAAAGALSPDLTVALIEPAAGAAGRGKVTFVWRPNQAPGPNDCFEVRFWEGAPGSWATGFGLAAHGQMTQVTVDLSESMEQQIAGNRLRPGITYFWGVLQVACDPYQPPQRILSDVRRFTYAAE